MKWIWLLFVTAVAGAQNPLPVTPSQFDAASVKAVQPENLVPQLSESEGERDVARMLPASGNGEAGFI